MPLDTTVAACHFSRSHKTHGAGDHLRQKRGGYRIEEEDHPKKTPLSTAQLLRRAEHAGTGWYWSKLTVYFLAGVVFGAIARLTNSILSSVPVHIFGDLTFFILIWPGDSARVLVTAGGADKWFWIHLTQAILFAAFALLAFQWLKKQTTPMAARQIAS